MSSIKQLLSQAKNKIEKVNSVTDLDDLHLEFLGRKGKINQLLDSLSSTQLKKSGKQINQTKNQIQELIDNKSLQIKKDQAAQHTDPTKPGIKPPIGHLHPISQAINEVESIFTQLGFVRRRYPEIESDWYYAEGLNIPKNHPARDQQETFYFSSDTVLTAHTSNGQLREMESQSPPIKMINISKTYRRQASHTHSPMFHQFEGLLIDKNVNMTNLIGLSNYFVKNYFNKGQEVRLRPHHFRFTEPSFEVDISCHLCKSTGKIKGEKCPVCKAGWLELGGAGMVHPKVLKNGGLDPNKYTGLAFGWGIERIIMMKHHFTDNLQDLYSTDLRFLQQSHSTHGY